MSDTIKGSEVIEDDHLRNATEDAKELKKAYLALNDAVITLNKSLATLTKGNQGQTAKEIQLINQALNESTNIRKNSIAVDKDKQALELKLKKLNSDKIQQNEVLKLQIKEQQKTNKELAQQELEKAGIIKKKISLTEKEQLINQRANQQRKAQLKDIIILEDRESSVVEKLNAKNRQLSRQRDKLTGATKKEKREIKALNKIIDRNSAKIKRNGDAMKRQRLNIGNYGKSFRKAGGLLKQFAGGLGLVGGVTAVVSIVKDAIKTNIEFEKSLSSLKSITGATTTDMKFYADAAKEIGKTTTLSAKQAIEGFKLIGSAKPELLANKEALAAVTEQAIILAEAAELELGVAAQSLAGTLNQFNLEAKESNRVINALAAGSKAGAADIPSLNAAIEKTGVVAASMNISLEQNIGLLETLAEKNIKGAEAGTKLKNVMLIMSTLNALPPAALSQLEKFGVDIKKVTDDTIPFQDRLKELSKISEDSTALVKVFGKENLVVGQTLLQNVDKVKAYTNAVTGTNVATEQAAINTDNLDGDLKGMGSAWEGVMLSMSEGNGVLRQVVQNITAILNAISGDGGIMDAMPGFISSWVTAFESVEDFSQALADTIDTLFAFIPGVEFLTDLLIRQEKEVKELTKTQKKNNLINEQALKIGKEILSQNKEELSDISVLIDALIDENTTREEKNEIIAKLNEDYPELIGNIDLETASTAQLINIKKELITQILNEGIARVKAEKLSLITAQIIDKELKKIGAGETGIKQLQKEIDELTASIPLIEQIADKVQSNLKDTVGAIDLSGAFREENDKIRALQEELAQLNIEFANAQTDLEKETIKKRIKTVTDELNRELGIRTQMLDDALDKEKEINEGSVNSAKTTSGKKIDLKKKELDELLAIQKLHMVALENLLIEQGDSEQEIFLALRDQRGIFLEEELELTRKLYGEQSIQFQTTLLEWNKFIRESLTEATEETVEDISGLVDELSDAMGDAAEKGEDATIKANEKIVESFKEMRDESLDIIGDITDGMIANIDKRIAAREQEIEASDEEISRLQKIGTANAAEAIKAEKIGQAKDKLAIEALEKKKKNLQITVTGLERVSQLIGSGNQTPFATAGNEMGDFIDGLKGFDLGTDTTVADAFSKPHLNTKKDSYVARLGGEEHVIGTKKARELHKAGFDTTDSITSAAMKWQNRGMMNTAMSASVQKENNGEKMVEELSKRFENAIDNIEFPQTDFDMDKLVRTIKGKGFIHRTHYDKTDFNL